MNFAEAITALNNNCKVRREKWIYSKFIEADHNGYTVDEEGFLLSLSLDDFTADDWEIKD